MRTDRRHRPRRWTSPAPTPRSAPRSPRHPAPDLTSQLDRRELVRYARFRGAQARLGRNWRDWPAAARAGTLDPRRYRSPTRSASTSSPRRWLRRQLHDLRQHLERDGMRLGLDLAVGVHPDGYDPWSRQHCSPTGCRWALRPTGLPERAGLGLQPGAARGVAPRGSPVPGGVHRPPGRAGRCAPGRPHHGLDSALLDSSRHGAARGHLRLVSRRGTLRHPYAGVAPPSVRGGG